MNCIWKTTSISAEGGMCWAWWWWGICLKLKRLASGLTTACCLLIAQALRSPAQPSEMHQQQHITRTLQLVCFRLVYKLSLVKDEEMSWAFPTLKHKTVFFKTCNNPRISGSMLSNAAHLHLFPLTHKPPFKLQLFILKHII